MSKILVIKTEDGETMEEVLAQVADGLTQQSNIKLMQLIENMDHVRAQYNAKLEELRSIYEPILNDLVNKINDELQTQM